MEVLMKRIFVFSFVLIVLISCSSNKKSIDELYNQMAITDARIAILTEQIMLLDIEAMRAAQQTQVVTQPAPEPVVTPEVVTTSGMSDAEINRIYENGRRMYESRVDYPAAIRIFQVITTQAPRHELAANSQYWIAESFYAMGDWTAARNAFQIVVNQYPDSNKYIDSQVKIALTWMRQNRPDTARTMLENIRRTYPTYERMSVVEQNLRRLR